MHTPNAFIQKRVKEKKDMATIKLRGVLVDSLCKISSDYKAHVSRYNRWFNQFLLRCQNALYGTMVTRLVYYFKFTKSLTKIGFVINPHDPCVANKVIEGS